jgi:transcriptional regulator with XRE-family HTH domain
MMFFIMENEEKMRKVFAWAIKKTGLSQIVVAQKIGCSQPNISQIKHGRHKLKWEYLEKLSEVLKTNVKDMVIDYESDPFRDHDLPPPDTSNIIPLDTQPWKVIEKFQQKKTALQINQELVEIEEMDPVALKHILVDIRARKNVMKEEQEAERKKRDTGNDKGE